VHRDRLSIFFCLAVKRTQTLFDCFETFPIGTCHPNHLLLNLCLFLFLYFTSFIFQILAFLLLRNVPGSFRAKFSKFYAWVGTISLEVSCLVDIMFYINTEDVTQWWKDMNFIFE